MSDPTLEIAQEALKDIINPKKSVITYKDIIDKVAEVYDVTPADITSQKRNAEYVYPRHIVMYMCFEYLSMSYSSIAKMLDKKDHTSIIH